MRVLNLIDGVVSPAIPIRRLIHKSHAAPGLSFTHPDSYANWRVVMPLGAADFYSKTEACPTLPDFNLRGEGTCKFCGNNLDPQGKCHGRVPAIPPQDQRYSLIPLNAANGSPFLAAKERPEDADGIILLWDDSGLGDSVAYMLSGNASMLSYGHDNQELDLLVYPVVSIKGPAILYSTVTTLIDGHPKAVVYEYEFTANEVVRQQIHAPAA